LHNKIVTVQNELSLTSAFCNSDKVSKPVAAWFYDDRKYFPLYNLTLE